MSRPQFANPSSSSPLLQTRIFGLIVGLALGWFLVLYGSGCWIDYWLLKDAREGTAIVSHDLWAGHNAVAYRYIVDGKQYGGESGRNYRDPRSMNAQAGGKSAVHYSASHPWLSSLNRPEGLGVGFPVVLPAVCVEAFAVITIVNPKSRWALNFTGKKLLRG